MSSHYIKCGMKNKIGVEVSQDCDGNEYDKETDNEYEYVRSANDDIELSDDMADACKTYCQICFKVFTLSKMRYHTMMEHNLQITQYKQIYGHFNEDESLIIKIVYHKCHICGKIVLLDNDRLGGHIKGAHKMKEKDYKALFMTLTTGKRQSTQLKKDQESCEEDYVTENHHIGLDEIGMKRKREKVDRRRNNNIVTAPKVKSLLWKERNSSDNSVQNKSKFKTLLKRKEKFSLNDSSLKKFYSDVNDVKAENTDPNENESPKNINSITAKQHVANGNWLNSDQCRNDNLYCNGGPVVKEGWKICFEEQKVDGRKVMVAKYMSPNGKVFTRGSQGYHIPELEIDCNGIGIVIT